MKKEEIKKYFEELNYDESLQGEILANVDNEKDIESLYETRTIVNGVEVTNEDKDIIIDYLRVNNIPVINRTYICTRKKYLDGNFNSKIVEQQKQELTNKQKAKILV